MPTDLIFHETFTKHILSPGHPESPERLKTALDYVNKAGLLDTGEIQIITPTAADLDEIVPIHDRAYLENVREKSERGGGFFTLDTSVNEHTYDAAMLAAGGGILAVDRVLNKESKNGFLLCRPPGHHAEQSSALGFCFINNIAVAANHLIQKMGLRRILIVDYDAHHGNGTQNAFYSSDQVLYIGLHQDGRTMFPGTGFPNEIGTGKGEGYNINLAMYPGAGDTSFRLAFDEIIEPVAEAYQPEFVLVSVGFDGHFEDPLTSLGLTTSGLAMMNSKLKEIALNQSNGHLVVFLEGGYNLEIVGKASQNILEELSGVEVTPFSDTHTESDICTEYTNELISTLKAGIKGTII
ncbi:MAG: histone deacetylase family protein [Candidatus Thorarchaeota archaeon]